MTAETEPLTEDGATLRRDLHLILAECHRDPALVALREQVPPEALGALADVVARKLGPRIGGRYVPKRDDRALRDIAVWREFNGRNHKDVLKKFAISRRLLYSILSRRRREQP